MLLELERAGAKRQEKRLAIISVDKNNRKKSREDNRLTFTIHSGPSREILHKTSDVTEAIRESLKLSDVRDVSVGSEPPSFTGHSGSNHKAENKGSRSSWYMVQVWVKCPRLRSPPPATTGQAASGGAQAPGDELDAATGSAAAMPPPYHH